MKKVLVLILLVVSILLSSCVNAEDYYTKEEFNEYITRVENEEEALTARIAELEADLATLYATIALLEDTIFENEAALEYLRNNPAALVLTQSQRYFFSIMDEVLGGDMMFGSTGTPISGEVGEWGYGYVILEFTHAVSLQIQLIDVAPGGVWDLNIYPEGTIYEAAYSFTEVLDGQIFIVNMPAGFVTIEFDSYADVAYPFSIRITEIL